MIQIDNVDEFRKCLAEVSAYASLRTTVPSYLCVDLDALDGKLKMSCYDGFRSCTMSLNVDGSLAVMVDARKFKSVVDNLSGKIELSEDGAHLRVKSGSANVLIACVNREDAPKPDGVKGVSIDMNAHELADMLSFGINLSRAGKGGGENAVQIVPEYGVVTSDSFIGGSGATIVCHQELAEFSGFTDKRVCLKSDYVKSVVHGLRGLGTEDVVKVTICDSHVSFTSDLFEICVRRLENGTVGNVPLQFLRGKREWPTEFVVNVEDLLRILGIMAVIAPPEKRSINLRGEGSVLMVSQAKTEFGTSEHSLDVMTTGEFEGEVFVNMDTVALVLSCFGRQNSVVVRYSEDMMSVSMDGKEAIFAATTDI